MQPPRAVHTSQRDKNYAVLRNFCCETEKAAVPPKFSIRNPDHTDKLLLRRRTLGCSRFMFTTTLWLYDQCVAYFIAQAGRLEVSHFKEPAFTHAILMRFWGGVLTVVGYRPGAVPGGT